MGHCEWNVSGCMSSENSVWWTGAIEASSSTLTREQLDRAFEIVRNESRAWGTNLWGTNLQLESDTGVCLNPPGECNVCEPVIVPHPEHDRNQWQQAPTFDQCGAIERHMSQHPKDGDIISHIDEALRDYDAEVAESERQRAEQMRLRSRPTVDRAMPGEPAPE